MHAVVADRFVALDARGRQAIDLATGARVNLFLDPRASTADVRARAALCDRLARLRHPLLRPVVDYGAWGTGWFEAHERLPPVMLAAVQTRQWALHVVRFLRAAGVELTAESTERNIRPAIKGIATAERPIGVFLRERPVLDAIRTVLEAQGPSGTTAIAFHAPEGAGLRTAFLQLARLARLAGYVVLHTAPDPSRIEAARDRHLCVLDWRGPHWRLPAALAASAGGARRHVWIRFSRLPVPGAAVATLETAAVTTLEPMMCDELTAAIFVDHDLGPTAAEVRMAVAHARGLPGLAIAALAGMHAGRGAGWVHEQAPEYGAPRPSTVGAVPRPKGAGVARLERAVEAAAAMARRGRHARALRILSRCGPALAARGAPDRAASAACALGDVLLTRGRPAAAAAAFDRARGWARESDETGRVLIGLGRALLEQGRLEDAEATLRTAVAGAPAFPAARSWLGRTLWHRGQFDAAQAAADGSPALLSRILLSTGQIEAAAQAAQRALLDAADTDFEASCDAHLMCARVKAAIGDVAGVRHHAARAAQAARDARHPALRLVTAAEILGSLEDCGIAPLPAARERLLRAAGRLPALAAATVRVALRRPRPEDARLVPAKRADHELIRRFEALVDAIHDAPDEASALQVMAADLLRALDGCSVVIRSSRLDQIVAAAGRPWPGEAAVARPVLHGADATVRYGATPEAAAPVRAAGAIAGSLAVRWVAGANPPWDRVREILRVTAVAAAPMLRAFAPVAVRAASGPPSPDELFGTGAVADGIRGAIGRAAAAPYPVLVEGESGSGKELVARAIHTRSARRARRLCAVNCAALTEDLLEAELFGHTRGAFTGAGAERAGLFEEADQGTLFLDEVGELSPRAQAKLLRVLQEGEVRRVGENVARRVDVRIVAATNRSLEAESQAGRFRADLRFRLDVIRISIPPLRERAEDVPGLAARLWADAAARVGSRAVLGEDLLTALARYDWPGNVRELQNVMAALAVHGPRRGRVPAGLLPSRIAHEAGRAPQGFDAARVDFERRFVRAALARAGGRRSEAAQQLRVSRQGLAKIIKRLGLEPI
jgi:DNA-binding NtrC family response regulator/tetratricopeptide (TPR) repeat protein